MDATGPEDSTHTLSILFVHHRTLQMYIISIQKIYISIIFQNPIIYVVSSNAIWFFISLIKI